MKQFQINMLLEIAAAKGLTANQIVGSDYVTIKGVTYKNFDDAMAAINNM